MNQVHGAACEANSPAPATPDAERVLDELLAVLAHDNLVQRDPATEVPAELVTNEAWVADQIRLRGEIWGIDDPFVLGTLWWYSVTTWLVMPTVTSWFASGQALSARLADLRLYLQPDSRIPGSRSLRLAPPSPAGIAAQLRESLGEAIDVLAPMIGKGERRLWSFAVDAITGRILVAAQHLGRTEDAREAAVELVTAIDPRLPEPRLTVLQVPTVDGTQQRQYLRRSSCCLLYVVAGQPKCATCPRQRPDERLQRLAELR